MEMDDELENFIKDQRAKVAEDKANLKQDPSYMEIRANYHKAYDPTIKENIPPFKRSTAQGKEESQCLSLPLGDDYERKKQKLQQELRLDYRRYMAQKKHFDASEPGPPLAHVERTTAKEHLASLQPPVLLGDQRSPRPPSRRDASTLTEGRRGVHRWHRPGEGRGPWAEEDGPPPRESRTARRGRAEPVDGDSEGDFSEEELERMERRRLRQMGLETLHSEKRRPRRYYKADGRFSDRRIEPCGDYIDASHHGHRLSYENRERKEAGGSVGHDDYQETHHRISTLANKPKLQVAAGTWEGGRSRLPTNKYEAGFATGLMIGEADAEGAVRRRKELYRQELQEQIAEQQRNRKREKDLELRVAATGATDPEKQPDRIRQFGPSGVVKRREGLYQAGLELAPPGGNASGRPGDEKPSVDREREKLPPEQPRVAFQSPLLEYSAELGLGLASGGLTPYGQALGLPRGLDTPRIPGLAPHPPPLLADAYRTPCDEAYLYYGARNPLDPSLPYHGQMAVIGGAPPMPYLVLPPTGGGRPSRLGPHSPHSGGSSHTEPPLIRPNNNAAHVSSGISVFPAEKICPSKETVLSYKEALKEQIQERQERRRLEREERERYEAKLEVDMKNHEPWGRGGGGAPLRDSRGNLITDLNQMHKLNEEAYIHPETWQKRATATATANMTVLREDRPPSNNRVSGFAHVQTPQFARGSVFTNQPTPQQLLEQDKYKTYLKQQIEEKRLKEAEERENMRLEEEKEERRLAEQRAHIQREYEEEQEKKKRKEMEQKAKNEELTRLAEERKKEVERKKKEAEEKENAALRRQYERERRTRLEEYDTHHTVCSQERREPSPPIPTLQKRGVAPQYTPRPPTMDSRRSTAPMSECSLSGLQSPPVPARKNQLRAADDQRGVISELSALRRQLRSEQKRVEGQLLQSEWEELDSPMTDRHRQRPQADVFDMARLRLQVPVRRPSSRNPEPSNLLRIHDSLQLRYPDSESRYGYSELTREDDIQSQADHREQQRRMTSLRRKPADDYFDLSPPRQPTHYMRSTVGDPQTDSLLESDSAFIDPLGDAYPVPPIPEQRITELSARERRRLAKMNDPHYGRGALREPIGQPDYYSLQANSSLTAEQARERERHNRTKNNHGQRTGELFDDEEELSPPLSPHGPDHRSSVETVATEPWLRPESSDTLKRLMTGPSRRERLTGRETNTHDWDVPSTCHS